MRVNVNKSDMHPRQSPASRFMGCSGGDLQTRMLRFFASERDAGEAVPDEFLTEEGLAMRRVLMGSRLIHATREDPVLRITDEGRATLSAHGG